MKGIVFTEFLEMVEEVFSWQTAEAILEECELASGGVYTAVGTYDHHEMLALVGALARQTGLAAPDLVQAFGRRLFARFVVLYPHFFEGVGGTHEFLSRVESVIHDEVRKLYPDAQLPKIECRVCGPGRMEVTYRSSRPFAELAEGLIRGCAEHFGEEIELSRRPLEGNAPGCVFSILQPVGAAE